MTVQLIDVQQKVTERIQSREIRHTPFLAQIVNVHGSVFALNRPNYVWIAESAQPESRHIVFNKNVAAVAGLNVWVTKSPKPPYQLEIEDVYVSAMLESEDVAIFNLPLHGVNHQYPSEADPGIDKVLTFLPAIQPLKTTGNGVNLIVTTQPYIYHLGGVRLTFSGDLTDLNAYLPSAGQDVRLLLYYDLNIGGMGVVSGTEVPTGDPAPYPDIPTDAVPSAYVLLQDGQVVVDNALHIDDTRDIWGADRGDSYEATMPGQILYSVDGATFTAELPMTNEWGIMLTTDGLIMIV